MHIHNQFNLVCLPIISSLSIIDIISKHKYTNQLFYFTSAYLITDICFILTGYSMAKSKKTVLAHHLVTQSLMFFPFSIKPYNFFLSWLLLIEINTIFLLLKSIYKDNKIISYMFYASWILIRNVILPYFTYISFEKSKTIAIASNQNIDMHRIAFFLLVILNIFQINWTIKLFTKKKKEERL